MLFDMDETHGKPTFDKSCVSGKISCKMAGHKLFVRGKPLFKDVLNCQGDSLLKPYQTFVIVRMSRSFCEGHIATKY